jgi:predicted phosphodiesterase
MNKVIPIIFVFCLILASVSVQAQEDEKLIFSHGPYLQNVSETAATIIFATNKLVVPGVKIKSGAEDFKLAQNTNDGLLDVGSNLHQIRIENLQPGKEYQYKLYAKEIEVYRPYNVIFGEELISEAYSFKTFTPEQKEINFTVFCDIHDKAEKLGKYLDLNNVSEQDCYFLNGDIMGHLEHERQIFASFIDTCVSRFATQKPFFYARGNHETRGRFARELKNYLDLPNNEFYYAQTIGNTRFIVLDGGEDKPDTTAVYAGLTDFDNFRLKELEWLKKEVAGEAFQNAQFKIVIVHMPIIQNKMNWYGMEFLAEHFGPVLEKAGIDLMISGHTHKNAWIKSSISGFGYPVMISSNNNYIEANVDEKIITLRLKDLDGKVVEEKQIIK